MVLMLFVIHESRCWCLQLLDPSTMDILQVRSGMEIRKSCVCILFCCYFLNDPFLVGRLKESAYVNNCALTGSAVDVFLYKKGDVEKIPVKVSPSEGKVHGVRHAHTLFSFALSISTIFLSTYCLALQDPLH